MAIDIKTAAASTGSEPFRKLIGMAGANLGAANMALFDVPTPTAGLASTTVGITADGATTATDVVAAINALITTAATTTGEVQFAKGNYAVGRANSSLQTGGIRLKQGLTKLSGRGSTITLINNASLIDYTPQTDASGVQWPAATRSTISADITAGQNTITVATPGNFPSSGLVFMRLAQEPADAVESTDWAWANFTKSGSVLTLDIKFTKDYLGVTNPRSNPLNFSAFMVPVMDGLTIEDFVLVQSTSAGAANAEESLNIAFFRNCVIRNIRTVNPGAGIFAQWCENVVFENYFTDGSVKQSGQASKGRSINIAEGRNIVFRNHRARECEGTIIFCEASSRLKILGNLIEQSFTSTAPIFSGVQNSFMEVEQSHYMGAGGQIYVDTGGTPARFRFKDHKIECATEMLALSYSDVVSWEGYLEYIVGGVREFYDFTQIVETKIIIDLARVVLLQIDCWRFH